MKRLILLTTMAFASVVTAAELRKDHPRMFFNSDTWPQVKARADGAARTERDELLARCDSYPANPVCSGMDPIVFGEVKTATGTHKITAATPINTVKEWGVQAAECALAWRFTGKSEYLEKAKKMLEVSIAAYHTAYGNGREVCWYSTSRILALTAYDWIYEALTPEERKAIIVPLMKHVEETQHPPRKIIRRNIGGVQTGFYGVESLAWYAGLAAAGDGFCDELAEKYLKKGMELGFSLLKFRAEGAGDDGALSSAVPGYCLGAYPWSHFNFMHTYRSAYGENLAVKYPSLALFPNWIYWTWIPNAHDPLKPLFSGFGDDFHDLNELPMRMVGQHMTQYMEFFKEADLKAARIAASLRAKSPKANMSRPWPMYPFIMGAAEDVKPYSDAELEGGTLYARHFETLGQFLLRSGWKTDSTYCTFTAGAKLRMHKHHDENNFVIYKHDFLALDSGTRGIETDWNLKYYYAQSVAHNVVLIHKPGEELPGYWGPKYDGPEGKTNYGGMYGERATPLAFETNDDFTYIASDATKCYGEKCTESVRQFVHLLPDVFIVYDRVGAADARYRKEWLLHMQNEPSIEGTRITTDCGKGRLFCETLLPMEAKISKVGGEGKEFWSNGKNWEMDSKFHANALKQAKAAGHGPYFGAWRIEVSPADAAKDDRFLHVLTATDTGVAAPVATADASDETHDGVTVTIPNHMRKGVKGTLVATFRFNRTGTVGGTVRIAFTPEGGAAQVEERALTDKVTPQAGVMGLDG